MKKQLANILENSDLIGLKTYIENNYSLDYSFNVKNGEHTISVNPLFYAIIKNPVMANFMVKYLDNLMVKDFLSSSPTIKISYFPLQTFLVRQVIFETMNKTEKSELSQHLFSMRHQLSEEFDQYLSPEFLLKKYIETDDSQQLVKFLDKNSDFILNSPTNFLKEAIEYQAVFCFDIIKEHIKSMKSVEKNKSYRLK